MEDTYGQDDFDFNDLIAQPDVTATARACLFMRKNMTHNASNQERNCAKNFKTISASDYRQGTIRHLVLFKFKETTTIAIKQSVAQRFIAMQHDATRNGNEYIVSIEHGNQISCEAFGLGFEQGYIVTFQSEGDRNYYVGEPLINDPVHYDPVHHAFKAFVGPLLDERNGCLVFDFRPTLT